MLRLVSALFAVAIIATSPHAIARGGHSSTAGTTVAILAMDMVRTTPTGTGGTAITLPRQSGSRAIPTVTSNVAQKPKRILRRPIPAPPRGEVPAHALVTSLITSIRLNAGEPMRLAIGN